MENLHTKSKDGTLARSDLRLLLARQEVDEEDDYNETALTLAIRGGHASAVKLLLQNGADPNKKAPDGKTPLYMASEAPKHSARIVELLLEHNANPDDPIPELGDDTPLMQAIRRAADPDSIRLLVEHGASMTYPNKEGETAQSLADKSTNWAVQKSLRPKDEQPQWKPELENLLVSSGLFALAYFPNFKDIGSNAIRRLSALNSAQAGSNLSNSPKTESEFKGDLENFVSSRGLEDFYPDGSDYIAKVAKKAAELLKSQPGGTKASENVAIMARQAMYQPIFYCDDSGSMKKTDSMPDGKGGIIAQDRMTRQADLVTRMGDLMTRAAPEGTVHLRFINSPDTSGNNLTEDQLEARMKFTPDGSTRLGTNLKAKVLDEFVHQPLNANTELKRPLLIMVVTDGCPNEEGDQDFHDAIVDSLKFVKDRGYGQETLRYCLSQVGNAPEATNFLQSWHGNPLVPSKVYVSGEHLDAQYHRWLDEGDRNLDNWILRMLNDAVTY